MCDVVDLRPPRSVEFEGEMEDLANRLTIMLSMMQGLLRGVRPKGSRLHRTLVRSRDRLIRVMDSIATHVAAVEEEMDRLFADLVDGQTVLFQTYDETADALVTSTLTTRCHTIHIQKIRSDRVLSLEHDNDDAFLAGLNLKSCRTTTGE